MLRTDATEGHPGAMLSLSANENRDGILWAAIHASGDSWHESRPGILHAYDADNIENELWNSLQNPSRDDCGEYSKMVPPTIANGKVFLASFGTQNVGTGQLCVYGLLPDGAPPAGPGLVKATLTNREVNLSWSAVDGAITYSVDSLREGNTIKIVSGLTSPSFAAIPAEFGVTQFSVTAWNVNGASPASTPVMVSMPKPGLRSE